jgi:hypothetical protein
MERLITAPAADHNDDSADDVETTQWHRNWLQRLSLVGDEERTLARSWSSLWNDIDSFTFNILVNFTSTEQNSARLPEQTLDELDGFRCRSAEAGHDVATGGTILEKSSTDDGA